VGYRFLFDGSKRPVHEDRHGQYVVNDDADRVYGLYIIPPGEPDTHSWWKCPPSEAIFFWLRRTVGTGCEGPAVAIKQKALFEPRFFSGSLAPVCGPRGFGLCRASKRAPRCGR
jgi:hypothetical protein